MNPVLVSFLSIIGTLVSSKLYDYLTKRVSSSEKIALKQLDIQKNYEQYKKEVFREYEEKFEAVLSELSDAKNELSKANEKIAKMMAYWDSMTRMAILHLEEDKPEVAKLFKEFQKQVIA
jgi:nitrogen fixation/metabolism regulation signal transduction histidine kinase